MKKVFDYFQSFNIQPSATLSILLSILTFSLGFIFNWISREISRYREKKSYRRSFKFILLSFAKSCRQQSDMVQNSLIEVGLLKNKSFIINYTPISHLDYLSKTDYNLFIKYFRPGLFSKKKDASRYSQVVSELFDLITKVKEQQEGIKEIMKSMLANYSRHEETYRNNLQDLNSSVVNIIRATNTYEYNQFDARKIIVAAYSKIFSDWQANGFVTGYSVTYPEIVQKIIQLNDKYPFTDFSVATSKKAFQCELAYKNVEKIDQFLIETNNTFAFFHRKVSRLVLVIAKQI